MGLPHSPTRGQAAADLAAALIRRVASRLRRRVPAVGEVGDDDTVIAAFPFTWLSTAEAVGAAVAWGFDAITGGTATPAEVLARVPALVTAKDAGEAVRALRPRIPVIAVTGTNGKTTTTRLIAHLMAKAGHVPGWSSTDGIVVAGEVLETGDWSGPGGAGRVLADPRVTVAVTETARGGILLRGVGTASNDVSVVTNISADHLGLLGVHTLDQLARVKAVVPRITKPTGWAVLNADDPLVLGMRMVTRARPWLYSLDPGHPALRQALEVRRPGDHRRRRGGDGVPARARPHRGRSRRGDSVDAGRHLGGERVERAGSHRRRARRRGGARLGPRRTRRTSPPTPRTTPVGSTSTASVRSWWCWTSHTTRPR